MQQKPPEFLTFGDAARYFFGKFSESAPVRFQRYLDLSDGREIEAAAKYRWNLELSSALLPCFHAAELTLRNAIHQAMCQKYLPTPTPTHPDGTSADDEWWFDVSVRGAPLLFDRDYNKVKDAYAKVANLGHPTTPKVVAELPFGFWVELLNSNYDESIVVPMLATTMRGVQRTNPTNRRHGWLRARFGEIRDLRNRVSHHEPIFHREKLRFIWEMAWQLASETNPYLANTIKPSCRFAAVRREQWTNQEKEIRAQVNYLYGRYKRLDS